MTILNILGISDAYAAAASSPAPNGGLGSLLPLAILFFIGAYFLMIRPQNKRAKAHRQLMSQLAKGDEVVTIGGIVGKVSKINSDFIAISVNDSVDIQIQKSAVANVLPKGTIKSLE